jgi:hypothetical protein
MALTPWPRFLQKPGQACTWCGLLVCLPTQYLAKLDPESNEQHQMRQKDSFKGKTKLK